MLGYATVDNARNSQLRTHDTRNSSLHVSHSSHALSYNRYLLMYNLEPYICVKD